MMKTFTNIFALVFGKSAEVSKPLHASQTCPECGSRLYVKTDDDNQRCPNPDCPPQVLKRVVLWASPEAMDIAGCDAALVAELVNRGLVRDAAEFYRLKYSEIASLDGMDEIKTLALWDAIAASKQREAWRVLFGLGIPNIGAVEAQTLCKHFASLEDLFATGRERLLKLEGVTELMARSVTHWYGDPVNRKLVKRLAKAGVNLKTELQQERF
jgi:DNA ligase (NAD+)